MTMSSVVGKKFIPYIASPPEALATSSSLDAYDLCTGGCLVRGEEPKLTALGQELKVVKCPHTQHATYKRYLAVPE